MFSLYVLLVFSFILTSTLFCSLHFTTLTSMNSTVLYNMYCYFTFCKLYTDMQLHTFRIICKYYTDLFTLCLNYHYFDWFIYVLLLLAIEHSMSLHLPVALFCSMHSQHHGGGSRSGFELWLSDGWYLGLPWGVSACMRGWTVDGVRVCNLRHWLNSVICLTHTAYVASTKATLSIASIMTNNQNVLEHFGGVNANSLCQLLNINDDNDHQDDEPNIMQISSYYDDDINAKFDQLNIKVQQLKSNGYKFSAICLQETWLSSDSDTSLFKIDGYKLTSQGKMCSSHGGLAIYINEKFNFSTIDLNINSQIWEGQFIEIENIESNKSLILGNVYRPPNNTNNLYQSFTNEFIPILENLQRSNRETIIAGDFNIDLLKINNNATLGNYFNSVVAQSFFPQITLPTRFSDHNCTLIDNFLCKLKRSYLPSASGILVNRISDHLPYFTFLNFLTSKRNGPSRSIKIQT